jgi:GNAT superfamily N-acetyltransferase
MQEPIIRRAGSTDAEALAAIGATTFAETFGHLYPPEHLARFLAEAHAPDRARADLADPRKAAWLVELRGRAVGYALAGPCDLPHVDVTARCGELKRLYLLAEVQNSGVGGRLFDTALAWLEAAGPPAVWIGVWSENFGAQRFYSRRGFERAGEYGFRVGDTVDREFILRRRVETSSNNRSGCV